MKLRGVCIFHTETGTEGGYWAFQDSAYISPPKPGFPCGEWSYSGLHILKDGDELTIYDKKRKRKIVWRGLISLRQHSLFTQDALGFWIHADQIGIKRETWAKWFFKEYPATLIQAKKKTK